MLKKILIPVVVLLVLGGIGFGIYSVSKNGPKTSEPVSKKQIINAIPIADRPFVALFPHPTNKLITLMIDKIGSAPELSIDLEYLSGNSLKGGRTSVSSNNTFPYSQAFLLGSCSSGGKCSFDTDITTGTIKTKIEGENEINVLKSNYVFVDGRSSTSDQKVIFEPGAKLVGNYIVGQTHGYLSTLDQEAAAEPVVITSDDSSTITGTLTIYAPDATSAVVYDGKSYQEIEATKEGSNLMIELNQKPWTRTVTIIRDDLKGAEEETTLYLIGPIVPIK